MLPETAEGVGLRDWSEGGVAARGRALERAERASSSDHACPEEVFESHYERLVASLTVAAGSREEATDAVQEAFARLIRAWERLSTYEDPAGWVRRVALNHIRDQHRHRQRQSRLLVRIGKERQIAEEWHAPEEPAGSDELKTRLEMLPLKQRTALGLYYVGHLDVREVAEAMGVTAGTVKQHLHRGRKALRQALKEACHD